MTTTNLFDDAARTAIASDLDHNLFVEAGAGTGKTSALVARVVALVRRGTPIDAIAAIAFTEAAAAELRERIREALGAAARTGGPGAPACRAALDRFDHATISTLHAFAHRVLREFPVEAGLPPGFEVVDDIQASIDFGVRWEQLVDRLTDDPAHHRGLSVVGALGFRMARLEPLARHLHADWDRIADDVGGAGRPPPVPVLDCTTALAALDAAVALAAGCTVPTDLLRRHLVERVAPFRDALRAAPDETTALDTLAARPALTFAHGRQRCWPDKAAVQAALVAADDAVEAAVARLVEPAMRGLLDALADFVRVGAEERRRAGRVEPHDLLVLARDLVRRDAPTRATLHGRYRHILLDEFQDTDPIQIELAVRIATDDPDGGTRPWAECPVPPGRLFVVGDPKQSIHRFRRADLERYDAARALFGAPLSLTTSFRARPPVVEFVNRVFAPLFTAGPPGLQPAAEPLLAARTGGGPAITIVGATHPPETDLATLRRREAHELVTLVRRVRDDEWPVARTAADGTACTEPAHHGDIAILLPTRATLPYLEQALDDAGIPARIESRSLVYATTEVQELLAILAAVDDPADEVAIVAALRSPAFACRDDRLLEFRAAGGRWDHRAPLPATLAPSHPVVAAMAALRDLHEHRWWDTVSGTVERVIRERRLMELAVARPRPRDHWRRIRFVADAARAFVDGGGTSLRGFVAWLARQADEQARAVEVTVPEPDDDAVRILTVHGAKGLEFPVVVLAGLGVADRAQLPPVLWSDDGRPEVRIGSRSRDAGAFRYVTPGYEARAEHERAADDAEQVRLLYVAATRARDHLVVSLHHRSRDPSHASRLRAVVDEVADLWEEAPPVEPPIAGLPTRVEPVVADADDGRAWSESRARRIAAGRRRPVTSATALAHAAADGSTGAGGDRPVVAGKAGSAPPIDVDPAAVDPAAVDPAAVDPAAVNPALLDDAHDTVGVRRGRGTAAVGRAVHAVLQSADLTAGADLDPIARAQALAEGIPERAVEVRDLAASAMQSPVVRGAVEAGLRCWRAVPVGAVIDGVLVEGVVDLLIETAEGLVVVDYETDPAPGTVERAAALDRATVEAGAYALVLESALGRPIARAVVVLARRGTPIEHEVGDLRAWIARARAVLPTAGVRVG